MDIVNDRVEEGCRTSVWDYRLIALLIICQREKQNEPRDPSDPFPSRRALH